MNQGDAGGIDRRLAWLADATGRLYVVGGIPLVIIFLGVANLSLPYAEAQKWIVSIAAIVFAAITWAASLYVTLVQWRVRTQILAEQDALVLKTICDISRSSDYDLAGGQIRSLGDALQRMGVRSLLPPATAAPPTSGGSPS